MNIKKPQNNFSDFYTLQLAFDSILVFHRNGTLLLWHGPSVSKEMARQV